MDWLIPQSSTLYVIVGAGLVIAFILSLWILIFNKINPTLGTMDEADVVAIAKGKCGDSMKISLKFKDDRVIDAKYWTDGCRSSNECGAAATRLALNKTPEEIVDIDYQAIHDEVGGLPEDDWHCATLAAGVLQESLRRYLTKQGESQALESSETVAKT